jgi:hypothetical protein
MNYLKLFKEDRRTRVRKSIVDLMIAGLLTAEEGLAALRNVDGTDGTPATTDGETVSAPAPAKPDSQ